MKRLTYTRTRDLGQLLAELEAGVPALARKVVEGEPQAVFYVTGSGDEIVLLVPDETPEPAVKAIVEAHVPRAREAAADLRALAGSLRSSIRAATTLPQLKAALDADLFPLLRAMARGYRGDINSG